MSGVKRIGKPLTPVALLRRKMREFTRMMDKSTGARPNDDTVITRADVLSPGQQAAAVDRVRRERELLERRGPVDRAPEPYSRPPVAPGPSPSRVPLSAIDPRRDAISDAYAQEVGAHNANFRNGQDEYLRQLLALRTADRAPRPVVPQSPSAMPFLREDQITTRPDSLRKLGRVGHEVMLDADRRHQALDILGLTPEIINYQMGIAPPDPEMVFEPDYIQRIDPMEVVTPRPKRRRK